MASLLSVKPFRIPGTCILSKNPRRVVDLSHPAFILVLYFVFCDVKGSWGGGGVQLRCVISQRKIDFPSYTTVCYTQGPTDKCSMQLFHITKCKKFISHLFLSKWCWKDGGGTGANCDIGVWHFNPLTLLQFAASSSLPVSFVKERPFLPSCELRKIIIRFV